MDTRPQALHPPKCPTDLRHVSMTDALSLQKNVWQHRSLEETEAIIQRIVQFQRNKRGLGIVAVHGDTIVGYGQTSLWMQCAEISDLLVIPKYQGRGIGTAIIQYLANYLVQHNIDCIELGVAQSNPRALKLYQQLGFRECYQLDLDIGDGREPVLYLRLNIAPTV